MAAKLTDLEKVQSMFEIDQWLSNNIVLLINGGDVEDSIDYDGWELFNGVLCVGMHDGTTLTFTAEQIASFMETQQNDNNRHSK